MIGDKATVEERKKKGSSIRSSRLDSKTDGNAKSSSIFSNAPATRLSSLLSRRMMIKKEEETRIRTPLDLNAGRRGAKVENRSRVCDVAVANPK